MPQVSHSLRLSPGLTGPHRTQQACYETSVEASDWDGLPGLMAVTAECGRATWHLERTKLVQGVLTSGSLNRIFQICGKFGGSAGGQMGGQWHRTSRRIHIFLQKGE
jgi:hypothetical protein